MANTSALQMRWLQQGTDTLLLLLDEPAFVNRIVLQEELSRGQAVRAWQVEGEVANQHGTDSWALLASGQSIGNKRIAVLSNATMLTALRLRIVHAAAELVSIKNFAAHFCWVPARS